MFALQDGETLMDDARAVWEGIGVTVRTDDGAAHGLPLRDVRRQAAATSRFGDGAEWTLDFADEEEKIVVQLAFRCHDRFLLADVRGEIRNGNAFGRQRGFAPERGIAVQVGRLNGVQGMMANYRHKDWWTRPHFGPNPGDLPERTQSLLWKADDVYYQLLPVCGPVVRADLCGEGEGLAVLVSSLDGGRTRCEAFAFLLGCGDDPFELADRNVRTALAELDGQTLPRESRKYPEILDYFGWCSWDAFYHKVHEQGLLDKAEELRDKGLPVRWVMIDDGWSDTQDGKLRAFEADPEKFPQGLAHAVKELKQRFGIRWVGVWHTIAGYWGGVHPGSELAERLRDALFRTNGGSLIPYPDAGKGFGFWHAWHAFLERQGVDFVKVDSQSAVMNFLKHHRSVGDAAGATHQALEASVSLHFDGCVINCMGMASDNVWHRPKSAVSRNSDDFVPQEKSGFREHALQNAYNSYYHGPFYWGDWDMYWSSNHDDAQNALLRAISGGPVYVSDAVGRTDPGNIWPLIYRDGKIIRADRPANPTEDILLKDPTKEGVPLKLWNTVNGTGAVAAFHIGEQPGDVSGTVGIADVPAMGGEDCWLYEHFSGACARISGGERKPFTLGDGGFALYLLVPCRSAFTPIGLADKYLSTDAVIRVEEGDGFLSARIREGGVFVFAGESAPGQVRVNGAPAAWQRRGDHLFEVDCRDCEGEAEVRIERRA